MVRSYAEGDLQLHNFRDGIVVYRMRAEHGIFSEFAAFNPQTRPWMQDSTKDNILANTRRMRICPVDRSTITTYL